MSHICVRDYSGVRVETAWSEAFIPDTSASESLNAKFRRAVRHRGHFPNEQAALKVFYLVAIQRPPNWQDLTGRINGWNGFEDPVSALRRLHRSRRLPAMTTTAWVHFRYPV